MRINPEAAITTGTPEFTLSALRELESEIQEAPELLVMNRDTLERLALVGFDVLYDRRGFIRLNGIPVYLEESVGNDAVMIQTSDNAA